MCCMTDGDPFDYVNFMTHNLNLLSYIELVGGVFAPLLFGFLYKFVGNG